MTKKVLWLIPALGVIVVLFWLIISLKPLAMTENNYDLVAANQELRNFAYQVCGDMKFNEPRCFDFFPKMAVTSDSVQVKLLDLVDLFFIEPEANEKLLKQLVALSAEKIAVSSSDELLAVESALNEPNTAKYLAAYGIAYEKNKYDELVLKNSSRSVKLYFDSRTDNVLAKADNGQSLNFSALTKLLLAAQSALSSEDVALEENSHESIKDEQENFLLLGQSGVRYDTIILANVNYDKQRITFVSIPRDLWIGTQRINILANFYGLDYFVQKVEEISGVKIANYAAIDMFVFPEIIDEIGGIDFQFESPLIDPTYKTVDNGESGTLYFPAGVNHLNGVQALRVARSRHTTNDFSRSARQQLILRSVKNRYADLGTEKTILRTLPIFIKKLQTDVGYLKALRLALKIKDYDFRTGRVMSLDNVLRHEMIDIGNGEMAYALKPKDDDWNLLKIFIKNSLYAD